MWSQYALFLLQALTIVVSILVVIGGVVAIAAKAKLSDDLKVTILNEQFEDNKTKLMERISDKDTIKARKKTLKALPSLAKRPKIFVLEFEGDIKASAVENLRHEITTLLSVATKDDRVVLNLESGGGTVSSYGLAASQLARLKEAGIPLTVCVDKIAASGGYMMACVADTICAAPFAIIGSIGVVAQMPNFNRWLKKHDIDFEMITAGEYKRTLTMLGENTDKAREKFNEDINSIHTLFKDHIQTYRSSLEPEKVATGEYWLAKEAAALALVDKLTTSDAYLLDLMNEYQVIKIKQQSKPSLIQKIMKPAAKFMNMAEMHTPGH